MNSTILAAKCVIRSPARVPDSIRAATLRAAYDSPGVTLPLEVMRRSTKDVGPKPLVVVLLASDQPIPPESISSSNSPLATTMLA